MSCCCCHLIWSSEKNEPCHVPLNVVTVEALTKVVDLCYFHLVGCGSLHCSWSSLPRTLQVRQIAGGSPLARAVGFWLKSKQDQGYQGPSRSQGNVERGVNLCMISTAINPVAVGFFECDSFAKNMLKMEFGRLTVTCFPHFFAATK